MQHFEDRPQRRSALVARELFRLDINVAALNEARFAQQGSLGEHAAHCPLSWSRKNKNERRLSGVGFMIKASISKKLQTLPIDHSDRLLSLRLPIQDNNFVTVISVYAPSLQAETGVKVAFYRDLHNLLQQVDSSDKVSS